jgi:hypothetical protein
MNEQTMHMNGHQHANNHRQDGETVTRLRAEEDADTLFRLQPEPSGENVAQLRSEIDEGMGEDKVDYPDPAAAPLGTDDEAAGTRPAPRQVKIAAIGELRRGRPRRDTAYSEAPGERTWVILAMAAGAAAIAAATVIAIMP